jgi:hypothetical protein
MKEGAEESSRRRKRRRRRDTAFPLQGSDLGRVRSKAITGTESAVIPVLYS